MTKKKLSYFNYFVVLSMLLISGYFLTSLFLINKTSYSGEQADIYAQITEKADNILNSAYKMESNAHSFLLTNNPDNFDKYNEASCTMKHYFQELTNNCYFKDLVADHIDHLHELIQTRIDQVNQLVKNDSTHNMHNQSRIEAIDAGGSTMDEIQQVLNEIRKVSVEIRDNNRKEAVNSTENVLYMLSVFGVIMLLIVIISFNKMKREILANDAKTKEISLINNELKSMNENLENFAYVASHDLNEPLRKIRTFGDLIKEEMESKTPDNEIVSSHIDRMQNASARMQQLINDLLSFSRVSKQLEDKEDVNLQKIVDEVLIDLQIVVKEKKANISIDGLPNKIKADPVQMRQVFQNLISNSLKFTKEEITPKIEIDAKKVSKESIKHSEKNSLPFSNYWKITVKDNGVGFNQKFANKIFQVFYRLHGRSEYSGTGIGLSICKKVIDQHKGLITVDSEEGKGTIFTIYLPIIN